MYQWIDIATGREINHGYFITTMCFSQRFAKKLLAAVADKWDSHVVIIENISPPDWKVQTEHT